MNSDIALNDSQEEQIQLKNEVNNFIASTRPRNQLKRKKNFSVTNVNKLLK